MIEQLTILNLWPEACIFLENFLSRTISILLCFSSTRDLTVLPRLSLKVTLHRKPSSTHVRKNHGASIGHLHLLHANTLYQYYNFHHLDPRYDLEEYALDNKPLLFLISAQYFFVAAFSTLNCKL